MTDTFFNGLDVLYTMQSLEEIELRAPAVGAVFFLSRSESGGPFARVGYNLNSYCVAFCGFCF